MPELASRPLTFSIILPARDVGAHLPRVLPALKACAADQPVAEIILVDNGSTDDSVALARRAGLVVLANDTGRRRSIAALRNLGAQAATGTILAFLDADMLVPRNWLAAAAARYAQGFDGILGFVDRAPETAGLVARAFGDRLYHRRRELRAVDYLPGRNLFVPAAVFRGLGGFDAGLLTSEDKEFTLRAARCGVPVLSSPEAPVVHLGCERGFLEFVRKEFWRQGQTLGLARRAGFSRRSLRNPGLSLYHLLAFLVVLALALTGRGTEAWLAALAWLAPSLVLAARDVGLFDALYPITAVLLFTRWNVAGLALARQLAILARRAVFGRRPA